MTRKAELQEISDSGHTPKSQAAQENELLALRIMIGGLGTNVILQAVEEKERRFNEG